MDHTRSSLFRDQEKHVYHFGGFAFDPVRGAVRHPDGTEVGLRPKAVEVLRSLAASDGRMVDRNQLMQAAWPGLFVTDDNITQCIAEIRRALGGEGRQLLRTLPKRGYLLVRDSAPTEPTGAARIASAPGREARTMSHGTPPDRPSIAVLPFINLSGDPGQEYLSDGVSDDIIGQLARGGSLFVIARSSSFSYKGRCIGVRDIARELAVRYVLEGSVRHDSGCIHINAQLVEAETAAHIWANRYDRNLTAVFAVQNEIAQAVATELAPAIAKVEQQRAIRKAPATLTAWEAYQRGIWHISRKANNYDRDMGVEFFRQAVTLDPLFADAHAVLARHYVGQATGGGDQVYAEGLALAEAEARAALRLDPDNASAHASLAWIFSHRYDVASALEHADQAIELNVNDPSGYFVKGHVLVFAHRAVEARRALDTALRLDPVGRVALGVWHHLAVSSYLERDYLSVVATAYRVIRGYPDWPRSYPYLVASLSHLGRDNEARCVLEEAMSVAPEFLDFRLRTRPPYVRPEDHERMLEGLRKAGWQG